MIQTKSKRPTLIADVELMRHLRQNQTFPNEGLQLRITTDELARLIFTYYAYIVRSRNRDFIRCDQLEDCIWQLAEALTTPTYRFGVLFTGTCGNGKTTLLHALRSVIYHLFKTRPSVIPPSVNVFSGIDLFTAKEVIEGIVYSDKTFMHQDILMIDDLGHEPTEVMHYGKIHTPVIDLLEKRYARQKITIVSSNLKLEDIATKYKARVADRLEEMMIDIEFTGGSFRM